MSLHKLLWIATFAFPSSLFAYQQHHFYIAGKVGIFQADFNNTYLDQTDVIAQNISQLSSQRSYTGGIAIGYQQDCARQYLLGGEFSVNIDGNQATFRSGASTAAFSDTIQIDYHADLLFVPGIKLTESVASYLKLGLSLARIQDRLTSPIGYTPTNATYSLSKNYFGFAAGLGVKKLISNDVSLFSEANYHDYGSVNFQNFQNFTANYTHKTHIYSYDVVVGISYQFA